jgi:CheY-like chemotaxis protein
VTDWADAIEAVEMHSFDVIVADAILRGRQTGFDLLEEIAGRAPRSLRILISGAPIGSATLAAVDAYLRKPFSLDELLRLMPPVRRADD